eukprot:TRINITY_DN8471_c0_g1_i1.p1 TRINITY_DN8471_c0_g1~~TRINITY_DN8471_c0_g1_i1.p1  ORF type:complete len:550 (+),score=46.18 TRINITY_DN8471_c0_g1_i1:118-1767(+)
MTDTEDISTPIPLELEPNEKLEYFTAATSISLIDTPLGLTIPSEELPVDDVASLALEVKPNSKVEVKPNSKKLKPGNRERIRSLWRRGWKSVKSRVMSSETEEAWHVIIQLMKQLLADLPLRPIDFTMAVMLINSYYKTHVVRTELVVSSVSFLENAYRYMRFASAAYGWKLVYGYQYKNAAQGFLEGIKLSDETNLKILLEHTGVRPEDVLYTRWTSGSTFQPGHYMLLDHTSRNVVVAVRGTFHVRDALADLVGIYEPFKGGYAHKGMLRSARTKLDDLMPKIIAALKDHPGYGLVLVGHSLGAGTAALMACIIHDEYNLPSMHCYCFGPACVLSLDLANKCKEFVTSFIINDDLVCRLSCGSIEDLKKIIQHVLAQNDSLMARAFQIINAGNNLGQSWTAKLQSYLKCNTEPDLGEDVIIKSDKLYPPGQCFHLSPSDPTRCECAYDYVELSNPSLFSDIVVSTSMLLDHMPNVYEDSLKMSVDRARKAAAIVAERADPSVGPSLEELLRRGDGIHVDPPESSSMIKLTAALQAIEQTTDHLAHLP